MKKRTTVLLLAGISLFIFSCQKKDIIPQENAISAQKSQAVIESNRNGDGPYVLNMLIQLSGDEEVPAVNTPAKGLAHLKVSSDKKLYSKVIVQNLEDGDALLFAHVHAGATGVNGPVRIFLCHTAEDFGENIVTDLTDEQFNLLLNDATYVNAHSSFSRGGLVRGQIR
jgi:CHRD domain-containing protein